MNRIISGSTALLCVAAVASLINATQLAPMPGISVWDHLAFFFCVCIALGTGALVFEVGKMIGPEAKR